MNKQIYTFNFLLMFSVLEIVQSALLMKMRFMLGVEKFSLLQHPKGNNSLICHS